MLSEATLTRIVAALTEAPEVGFESLARVLGEHGIRLARSEGPEGLQIEHQGARATLVLPPSVDEGRAALIEALVRASLARIADEDARRRLHERNELLSEAAFEGIFVHVDGSIIDANHRMSELLGFSREEVLGRAPLDLCVAPEDRPAVIEHMQSRKDGEYVITGVRKDGSRLRAELHSKQGRLGERPVRVVAFRDVTERERTQALLKESEQRLRDLAEKAFDFVVTSRERVILDARGTIEHVIGFTREELLGGRIDAFVVPGVAEANLQRVGTFRTTLLAKDGSHVPAAVTAVVSSLDGEPVRVSGIRDLRQAERAEAERRRLEQRVERSERMQSLGVLAGGIAHDFNNLLVGVLGNADLLTRRLVGSDRAIAENVRTAARRAADLTRQMLVYAGKGETGPRVPVSVPELFAELDTLLGASLSKGAELSFTIDPRATVLADRTALVQVVMNLLTNASDALPNGIGKIDVRVDRVPVLDGRFEEALGAVSVSSGWVLVEVRDTGVGMDSATKSRIFEPFFSTKEKGHGLGLASCLGIVSAHGGAVLVESEPGVGSCFCVALPAHDAAPRSVPTEPEAATAGGRVLVIDDEPVVRGLLKQALVMEGWEVVEAEDALRGLACLAEQSFDVVVLDLTMPGVDGAEALRRLRASGHTVPVVLASGYAQESIEDLFEPGTYQGFLTKPFVLDELYRVMRLAKGA